MSDEWYFTKQYAVLAGYRLLVLANRLGCEDDFSRELHDRLVAGLEGAIETTCRIIELQREDKTQEGVDPDCIDWSTVGLLDHERERLAGYTIVLLDELEIDFDTYEYRVNGGEWHNALSADCDGVEIDYPTTIALSEDELGSLYPIMCDLMRDTPVFVTAARVVY